MDAPGNEADRHVCGWQRVFRISGILVASLAGMMLIVALLVPRSTQASPVFDVVGEVCSYSFIPTAIAGAVLLYFSATGRRISER